MNENVEKRMPGFLAESAVYQTTSATTRVEMWLPSGVAFPVRAA
jgi:hypothetical protein